MKKETATLKKIKERCEALEAMVRSISTVYPSMNTDQQRLISTSIGAALFYIPHTEKICYSGKISSNALTSLMNGEKVSLTKEHQMPRRVAALTIIEKVINQEEEFDLMNEYLSHYSLFNYVLPSENKRLIPFQKSEVFTDPMTAYQMAGIELVDMSLEEIKRLQKANKIRNAA